VTGSVTLSACPAAGVVRAMAPGQAVARFGRNARNTACSEAAAAQRPAWRLRGRGRQRGVSDPAQINAVQPVAAPNAPVSRCGRVGRGRKAGKLRTGRGGAGARRSSALWGTARVRYRDRQRCGRLRELRALRSSREQTDGPTPRRCVPAVLPCVRASNQSTRESCQGAPLARQPVHAPPAAPHRHGGGRGVRGAPCAARAPPPRAAAALPCAGRQDGGGGGGAARGPRGRAKKRAQAANS